MHDCAALEGRAIAAQPGATWLKFLVSKYHLKNVREVPATHSVATHSVASFLADKNYIQQIFVTSEPFFVEKAGVAYRTILISTAGYDPTAPSSATSAFSPSNRRRPGSSCAHRCRVGANTCATPTRRMPSSRKATQPRRPN